jgi:phage/plasmid-associated DNA primase
MGETQILNTLYKELRLDNWWKDLLGQPASYEDFDIYKAMESIPRTEASAAAAISKKLENYLSFVELTGRWYIWDERIHTPCDGEGIAVKIVKLFYQTLRDALAFVKDFITRQAQAARVAGGDKTEEKAAAIMATYEKGEFSKHRSFRDRIATDAGISAVVRMLRTECDVDSDYFENDQRWFVMRNYVLDLDDLRKSTKDNLVFTLLAHSPERPVTKYFDAEYVHDANLHHWDGFLERSIPNRAMRRYLQKVTGAAMMGTSKLRTIPNLYGPPGSGKSVFINTMFKLGKEGAGYSCMPDSKAIIKVSGQNFEQDAMRNRRFIGISEPSHSEHIDDDFLKKFTGDVWVETRTLNVKSSGWVPQGVVFVASNKPLRINTRDKAIVNRVQLIEFPIEFQAEMPGMHVPEERRMIMDLEDLILADRSRILSWIIQGMIDFVLDGQKLSPPEDVVAKRNEIVTDASTALRWVDEYVDEGYIQLNFDEDMDLKHCIPVSDAYSAYTLWAALAGERKPLSRKFFTQDIENKFQEKQKDEDGVWRLTGFVMTAKYLTRSAAAQSPQTVARF